MLGAAVSFIDGQLLGDCVTVEVAQEFQLHSKGRFVSKLPSDTKQKILFINVGSYFVKN